MNEPNILGFAEHFPVETDTSVNFVILFDWIFEIKVLLVKSQHFKWSWVRNRERGRKEEQDITHQSSKFLIYLLMGL